MNLGEMISNPTSPIYYWINQTLASSLLGLSGFLVGMIFAWMIWGRRRKRLKKARADN